MSDAALDEEIDKLNMELLGFYVHSSRASARLTEKRKELSDLKVEYDKKKLKADDETAAVNYKEKQLSTMKANLKEEEEKFEQARKQNVNLTEQLQSCYRQQLLVAESINDEEIKHKVLNDMIHKISS